MADEVLAQVYERWSKVFGGVKEVIGVIGVEVISKRKREECFVYEETYLYRTTDDVIE